MIIAQQSFLLPPGYFFHLSLYPPNAYMGHRCVPVKLIAKKRGSNCRFTGELRARHEVWNNAYSPVKAQEPVHWLWVLGNASMFTVHPAEFCFESHSFVLLFMELEYCIGKPNELYIQVLEETGRHLEANDISLNLSPWTLNGDTTHKWLPDSQFVSKLAVLWGMNQDKHQWHKICCSNISTKPPSDLKHSD